ncbi:MAG: hypothetical protein ABSF64_22155 [Bryobacteraceae bacterium]|jgi:hypothetical protein
MPLERVLPRMRRLAGAAPPQPGLMEFDWADLAGDAPLLPQELRAAVRDAATVDPEAEIRECWDLMERPDCLDRLRRTHAIGQALKPGSAAIWSERLYRNAALLIASAGAAAALRSAENPGQAWDGMTKWWRDAANRFAYRVGEDLAAPPGWRASAPREAAALLRRAGWDSGLLGFWTRWWLEDVAGSAARYAVPLAGYCAGTGFLADLVLTAVEPDGGYAIEHPDAALRPLGESLLAAVAAAAGVPRKGIAWKIDARTGLPGQSPPLDGDSLGAAAAAGFSLFDGDFTYDSRCLLIAAVGPGGRLERVGGQLEKLRLATAAGFTKAGVAFDTDLSDEQLRQAGPPETKRLRTVEDARRFARATQVDAPWL